MYSTRVFSSDGTGTPRRCATQTPTGSIDAATIDAASILYGLVGMIIDDTRMTMMFHDSSPPLSIVGVRAHVFSSETPIALAIMYKRPTSVFVCAEWLV